MKNLLLSLLLLVAALSPAVAKEKYAQLRDYAVRADAIIVCKVERNNGDGTITAKVVKALKGERVGSIIIRGETGHCVMGGTVSRFMEVGREYLVFLFDKNNTVGRLGGILNIADGKTLEVLLMEGFQGADLDRNNGIQRLPLEEAVSQIGAILAK
jgi:hypothetical protein